MFRSIFKNLLVTYLLILAAVVSTLSMILSLLYAGYIFREKRISLENAAYKINLTANDYYADKISLKELETTLNSMGYATDSKIYLLKLDRHALSSGQELDIGEGLKENYIFEALKKIMDGESVFHRKKYTGMFDTFMVFAGVPWRDSNNIQGAILLFSPVSRVTNSIARINAVIWITALVFIFLGTIIIYLNSRRISQPVKEIEKAAIQLARGETIKDIEVRSNDEIGRLSAAFNHMKDKLLETEKIRKDFIANVSHDLRTPLTSINGFVEGMLEGLVKPQDYPRYLAIIRSETTRLMRLTSDILQLAKIQSGKIGLSPEEIRVRELIEAVTAGLKSLADEKKVSFAINCDEQLAIRADRDKINQVLVNIIANAIQYSPEGGSISINVEDAGGDKVRFKISDNGIGIPQEELPYIFEKFYRVDKSRQSYKGGTGLGLNIAKSLVELHGGSIRAESRLGAGTDMIFELPVK